jgi:hypothetical protein
VSRRSRRRARDAASRLVPHITQDVRGPAAWSRAPAPALAERRAGYNEGGGLGIGGHVLALALADGPWQAGNFQVGRAGDFHTAISPARSIYCIALRTSAAVQGLYRHGCPVRRTVSDRA